MNSQDKAAKIVEFADEIKADRIETLDVRHKTSVTEFFVICSGTSDTHMNAIAERVMEKMRAEGMKPRRSLQNAAAASGWLLLDYGDVVFHVMSEEKRQFYDLETLWSTMEPDPNLIVE